MAIIHTRIDDRLIHGQVATMWTNQLGATRIMVIDNEAATNSVMKMSLKMATPNGVALSVLPIDKAVTRIKDDAYRGQRIFLIVKSPDTLIKIIKQGVAINKVNIGNLTFVDGKTKISNTVAITREELEKFHELSELGVEETLQLTPNDISEKFLEVADKKF